MIAQFRRSYADQGMRKYDKAITHCNALLKTMRIFRKKIIDNAYLVDSDISAMLY